MGKEIEDDELVRVIIQTVKKIRYKKILIKVNTMLQIWYEWQEEQNIK
ncbi:MAG: hypothetical protein J6J86_04805 [Lachnospiraceae bacterium]|nr:hypothetical protein [Lachnospiraceae bacterium]